MYIYINYIYMCVCCHSLCYHTHHPLYTYTCHFLTPQTLGIHHFTPLLGGNWSSTVRGSRCWILRSASRNGKQLEASNSVGCISINMCIYIYNIYIYIYNFGMLSVGFLKHIYMYISIVRRVSNKTNKHKCQEPPWADIITTSTAQGGGGSFKNRKPIGEAGCCESRMAERIHWWTERWLMYPLCLSLSLSLFLSLSLIIYLPTYLSINLSIYLSIHPINLSN